MVMAKDRRAIDGGARVWGWSSYDVLPEHKDKKTFLELFRGPKNVRLTDSKKKGSGNVNVAVHNPRRPQPLHGDIFIDFNQPLYINRYVYPRLCITFV